VLHRADRAAGPHCQRRQADRGDRQLGQFGRNRLSPGYTGAIAVSCPSMRSVETLMGDGAADSADTRRLLDEVRGGDRGALDRLLGEYRHYLRTVVELRLDPKLRARVDPSDVVQEAQLEAVRRVDGYLERPVLPFRLWLRQIAFDRLLMARRQ